MKHPSGSDIPTVNELRMTCGAAPTQWEGTVEDGRTVYVRFRHGELTVGLGADLSDAVGAASSSRSDTRDPDGWCKQIDEDAGGVMNLDELRRHVAGVLEIPDGVGDSLDDYWKRA
jgi:hypothetical protein